MRKTVSAVVSALNEAKTLAGVIDPLVSSEYIDEVIVVNDGSTDRTAEICRSFGDRITFLNYRENRGMGFAMSQGVAHASGEIIAFFDADLVGLNDELIGRITTPLLGDTDLQGVLGHVESAGSASFSGRIIQGLSDRTLGRVTGQRAYYREDLLPHLDQMAKVNRGAVVYLNAKLRNVKMVPMPNLKIVLKAEKVGLRAALVDYVKEVAEFLRGYALTFRA
jgi:glycosyltransferase involved in cell wall biosynthesis